MQERRKTRVGRVVGDKMTKTVVVEVETPKHHPVYKKVVRDVATYYVHDPKDECRVGDVVRIIETRPLSKLKRWQVTEIVSRGKVVEVQPGELT